MRIRITLALLAMCVGGASLAAANEKTVVFQNGTGGYAGTFDRRISERALTDPTAFEFDGSTVESYFVDGYSSSGTGSPDEPTLIRFDSIFGPEVGKIPTGATVLEATLQLTTSSVSNANTGGPYGVSSLNQAFDSSTSYLDFVSTVAPTGAGSRGPYYMDADPETDVPYAARPSGGFGVLAAGQIGRADVTSIVQRWSDGSPNYGVAVQSGFPGASDGWSFFGTGASDPTLRPQLSVTYTTDPIQWTTLQQGANGYAGNSMAWLQGGTLYNDSADDVTTDGSTMTEPRFLDGSNAAADSAIDSALIRFDDVFGAAEGQAPSDKTIAKAWLVVTTGQTSDTNTTVNMRSPGPFSLHKMLVDWDSTNLYTNFGTTAGLQEEEGEISAVISRQSGMAPGSEVWFDVTTYMEDVRQGGTDRGLALLANTSDGWQIYFNGADLAELRPRLVIASSLAIAGVPEDLSGDGAVDAADAGIMFATWGEAGLGDLNGDGITDAADAGQMFAAWTGDAGPHSVPEPPAGLLLGGCLLVARTLLSKMAAR